jgi:hypothetical protein
MCRKKFSTEITATILKGAAMLWWGLAILFIAGLWNFTLY